MAAVALSAAAAALHALNIVEPPENHAKPTRIAGANLTAGNIVKQDVATGNVLPAASDVVANAAVDGVVWRDVTIGQAITVFKGGIIDGFDLSALPYGTKVYLGAAGALDTAPGAVSTVIGEVVPGNAQLLGSPADKLLRLLLV